MIQMHFIYCALYFYYYCISFTSDHQALDSRSQGLLTYTTLFNGSSTRWSKRIFTFHDPAPACLESDCRGVNLGSYQPCDLGQSESKSYSVMSNSLQPHGLLHGILQARIPEQVAVPFSGGSSQPRDRTWLSHQGRPRTPECIAYPSSSGSSQQSNQVLLHCKGTLYQLSYQGSPTLGLTSLCLTFLMYRCG